MVAAGRGGYGSARPPERSELGERGGVETGDEARDDWRVDGLQLRALLIEHSLLGGDGGIGSCSHSGAVSCACASASRLASVSMVRLLLAIHGRVAGDSGRPSPPESYRDGICVAYVTRDAEPERELPGLS